MRIEKELRSQEKFVVDVLIRKGEIVTPALHLGQRSEYFLAPRKNIRTVIDIRSYVIAQCPHHKRARS